MAGKIDKLTYVAYIVNMLFRMLMVGLLIVVILSDVVIGWKIAMFVLTAYIALGAFS